MKTTSEPPMTEALVMAGVGIATGLAASVHCAAMCGGIATAGGAALSAGKNKRPVALLGVFHLARISSYAAQGALLAALGGALALAVPHFERVGRLVAALVMLMLALRILFNVDVLGAERLGGRVYRRVAPLFRPVARHPPIVRAVEIGVLWGFLPCGLSYSMLLVAAATGAPLVAAIGMLVFGLGTIPGLLGITMGASRLLAATRVRAVTGVAVIGCAVWTAIGALLHSTHVH